MLVIGHLLLLFLVAVSAAAVVAVPVLLQLVVLLARLVVAVLHVVALVAAAQNPLKNQNALVDFKHAIVETVRVSYLHRLFFRHVDPASCNEMVSLQFSVKIL